MFQTTNQITIYTYPQFTIQIEPWNLGAHHSTDFCAAGLILCCLTKEWRGDGYPERVIFWNSLLNKSVLNSPRGEPAGTFLLSQDVSQPSLGILLGGDSLRIFARKRTTSEWPLWDAISRAVLPQRVVAWLSAPLSIRKGTISTWPLSAAACKAVAPVFLVASFWRAPTSTKWRTTSRWPTCAAMNKGVAPSFAAWSLWAPTSTR